METDILLVVDMQNDFITGPLGTKEAQAIVSRVKEKIENFDGEVIYTQDSHFSNYLDTEEGKKLPIPHCIYETEGWEIEPSLDILDAPHFVKTKFTCLTLTKHLHHNDFGTITIIGLCTDICVISNALFLKAWYPNYRIVVDLTCCAGSTPSNHEAAAAVMRACQIDLIERKKVTLKDVSIGSHFYWNLDDKVGNKVLGRTVNNDLVETDDKKCPIQFEWTEVYVD